MVSINQRAKVAYDRPAKLVYFGTNREAERTYLSLPTFDSDWYWDFGYLGNHNCYYPLKNVGEGRNLNLYDALKADYILCPALSEDKNLWTFCELVKTAYVLRETAEIYHRGGSNYSNNPCRELLQNKERYEHINFVLLPALFKEIDKLFGL